MLETFLGCQEILGYLFMIETGTMDFSGVSEMVQTAVAAARRSGREAVPGIRCADVARIARSQMRGCLETPHRRLPRRLLPGLGRSCTEWKEDLGI